jgi:hypothetical protein
MANEAKVEYGMVWENRDDRWTWRVISPDGKDTIANGGYHETEAKAKEEFEFARAMMTDMEAAEFGASGFTFDLLSRWTFDAEDVLKGILSVYDGYRDIITQGCETDEGNAEVTGLMDDVIRNLSQALAKMKSAEKAYDRDRERGRAISPPDECDEKITTGKCEVCDRSEVPEPKEYFISYSDLFVKHQPNIIAQIFGGTADSDAEPGHNEWHRIRGLSAQGLKAIREYFRMYGHEDAKEGPSVEWVDGIYCPEGCDLPTYDDGSRCDHGYRGSIPPGLED